MKSRYQLWVSLCAFLMVLLQSCHEAPSKVINEEQDPTLDSFSLVNPANLSASLNSSRDAVVLRWDNTEPEKPNAYQIRVISVDQQMNESDTVVQVSSPMPTGRFRLSWTDSDMDSFQKKYSIRSQYEFESGKESEFSEWTDTVSVNLFDFNADVRYWSKYAYISMSYVIPADIPFSYTVERIVGDEVLPVKESDLEPSKSELEFRDDPVIVAENEFSYRLRLTIAEEAQEWIYLDTLRMSPEVVGPPDEIQITENNILKIDHSERVNSSHRMYVNVDDCEGNAIWSFDSNRSMFLTIDNIDECFPISMYAFSRYRMFRSGTRNFTIRKSESELRPEYTESYYPDQDIDSEVYDARSADDGEFMIAVGMRYQDRQHLSGIWGAGEEILNNFTFAGDIIAKVIGYDRQRSDGYYIMTTKDFLRFQKGARTEVKEHPFVENFAKTDWFYLAPNQQLLMFAHSGELSYYDYLTLEPKSRASVSYEKIRHLWDDLVLIENDESVKMMNVITGKEILSWPQSAIIWHTDHQQAALLLADGTVVHFFRDKNKPTSYSLPANIAPSSIKSMLPLSKDELLMSVIENENTWLLYYNSRTLSFLELHHWDYGHYGFHTGWVMDNNPSIYLGYQQAKFEYVSNSNYTIEEIEE